MKKRFENYKAAKQHLAKKHEDNKIMGFGYEQVARQILRDEKWHCLAFNSRRIDQVIKKYVIQYDIKFEPKNKKEKKAAKRKKTKTKKIGKSFYSSWEWKKLRYKVLVEHGAVCMCCGASKDDGARIVVDHIKPISKFPHLALDENNTQILCNDCNMGKSNTDYTDFRPEKEYPELDISLAVVMGERIH